MAKIQSANIPSIRLAEQGSAPGTPAPGFLQLYAKSDGKLYYKNDAGSEVELGAAGGGGGAPADAAYLTTAANGTLSAEVVIPGLAGHADRAGIGGGTFAEEFDSGTSPLTWNVAPATESSNSTFASHLYLSASDNTERRGYRAFAPGAGAFDVRAKVSLATRSTTGAVGTAGLLVADAGDTNRVLCLIAANSLTAHRAQGYTFAGSYTVRSSNWDKAPGSLYLRISRDGSNNCSTWWSYDGLIWNLMSTTAFTFTVAQAGIYLSGAGGAQYEAAIDWLRGSV